MVLGRFRHHGRWFLACSCPEYESDFFFLTQNNVSSLAEWVTGIDRSWWITLWMPASLSQLLIKSNTIRICQRYFFFFVSSKPYEPEPVPLLQAHFAVHTFCILSPKSHAVKFNYRISFHTQGNYGAGLIAVNSTSCQWSHHTAVTVTIWPHWNCTEPHNYLQSLAALFTVLLICMPHFIPMLLSINV